MHIPTVPISESTNPIRPSLFHGTLAASLLPVGDSYGFSVTVSIALSPIRVEAAAGLAPLRGTAWCGPARQVVWGTRPARVASTRFPPLIFV